MGDAMARGTVPAQLMVDWEYFLQNGPAQLHLVSCRRQARQASARLALTVSSAQAPLTDSMYAAFWTARRLELARPPLTQHQAEAAMAQIEAAAGPERHQVLLAGREIHHRHCQVLD